MLQVKNIFASWTQILLLRHMFPGLAAIKAMLASFQYCSLKMFPSNEECTAVAEGEVHGSCATRKELGSTRRVTDWGLVLAENKPRITQAAAYIRRELFV